MWTWIKKVYRLCKEAKVDISYINNENDFTIEFSRIDRDQDGETNDELSKEEFSVLSVFKTNKNAIKDDVIKQTGLSSQTIDRIIKSLKEKELLRRIDSNKNGYWEVLKSNSSRKMFKHKFAHTNYRGETENEIAITPSQIEIYNPGGFH